MQDYKYFDIINASETKTAPKRSYYLIVPTSFSASYKAKSVSTDFEVKDISTDGVYETGSALEFTNSLPGNYSTISVSSGRVVAFY